MAGGSDSITLGTLDHLSLLTCPVSRVTAPFRIKPKPGPMDQDSLLIFETIPSAKGAKI
jgi:hypothetical protein